MEKERNKPVTVSSILEEVINDMCDKYCKYPEQFTGDEEDELYKICDSCPLNKL